MSLSDQLAAQIREALEDSGLTQADLARAMGLTAKHVNQMVHGKSGALAMYDYAAYTLGVELVVTREPRR